MKVLCTLLMATTLASAAGAWIDVPLERQREGGCGASALAMVMQYWMRLGHESPPAAATEDAIYSRLYSRRDRGVRSDAMRTYLESNGFRAFAFAGKRADLEEQIAKSRPVIVSLKEDAGLHYVVVRAVDDSGAWINDPADGLAHRISWGEFEQTWKGAGCWMLLAVPRSLPAR